MKHTITEKSSTEKEVAFELTAEEFAVFEGRALEKLRQQATLKGFRKGKAPQDVLEQAVGGKTAVLEDAVQDAVSSTLNNFIKQQNWMVVGQPAISITKFAVGNPLSFSATFSIMPNVVLPENYKELVKGVEHKKVAVEPKELDEAVEWLRKSRSTRTPLDRPAQKGDAITIQFEVKDGEKVISASPAEGSGFILGEGKFLPGFEDNLVGLKAGEHKEFNVEVPKDYWNALVRGKKLSCVVDAKAVEEVALPEVNDEFAKALGNFENMEKLRQNIELGMLQEKVQAEKERWRVAALEAIAERVKVEIPEKLMEREMAGIKRDLENNATQMGMTLPDYLRQVGKTEEEFLKTFEGQAQKRIIGALVLRELAKKNDLKLDEKEVVSRMNEELTHYHGTPEQAEHDIDPEALRMYIEEMMLNDKVFELFESLSR